MLRPYSRLCVQRLFLEGFRGPDGLPGIKSKSDTCKAKALPLYYGPPKDSFRALKKPDFYTACICTGEPCPAWVPGTQVNKAAFKDLGAPGTRIVRSQKAGCSTESDELGTPTTMLQHQPRGGKVLGFFSVRNPAGLKHWRPRPRAADMTTCHARIPPALAPPPEASPTALAPPLQLLPSSASDHCLPRQL